MPRWGPYELDEEGAWHEAWRDDESSILDSIAVRWAFSHDPDVCDDAGANTHYVGMVHPNSAPYAPYAPDPADRATDVPVDQVLSWRSNDADKDPLTYDVSFGTSYPPPVVSENLTTTVYDPGPLVEGTGYYWSVNVSDGISITIGSTWRFQTTGSAMIYLPLLLRQ